MFRFPFIPREVKFFDMFEASWNKDLIDELTDFPNSDYKDIVDAFAGAYNYFMNMKNAGTW